MNMHDAQYDCVYVLCMSVYTRFVDDTQSQTSSASVEKRGKGNYLFCVNKSQVFVNVHSLNFIYKIFHKSFNHFLILI